MERQFTVIDIIAAARLEVGNKVRKNMEQPYDSEINFAFSKAFFEKHKKEAEERYEGMEGEGYDFKVKAQRQEINVDKNYIGLSFLTKDGVWCYMKYSIEIDIWEYLADLCIKRFNKLKAILQGSS